MDADTQLFRCIALSLVGQRDERGALLLRVLRDQEWRMLAEAARKVFGGQEVSDEALRLKTELERIIHCGLSRNRILQIAKTAVGE